VNASDVPTLLGKRCTLRALQVADAASLARHADNPAVARNLLQGFPSPYTQADALAWCSAHTRGDGPGYVWGIEVQGAIVGCTGVNPQTGWMRCNAEVGYWLGQDFWGRGIATEGLGLVTDWAWQSLPEVTRLFASIFSWNVDSEKVARKCGYVREGLMRQSAIKDGQVIDRALWASYRASAPETGAR
jgi:RimJ/RimL family protein N-acetyltransferase